jgi:putative membrane protein insertion efficiency factor
MRKSRKAVGWTLFALCFYLAAEACVPPSLQPTARISVALIHAYQATGSPMMEAGGVRCRYTPTCSHYAEDAIAHYGFLSGGLRTAGRLWRCSPWGGCGYDPAVDAHPAAFVAPQQETPEEKKAREDQKAAEQFRRDMEKIRKEMPKEAGKACAGATVVCIIAVIGTLIGIAIQVVFMVYTYKDAKARGDQNAVLWLVLIFFLHTLGFIVYLVARPKGELNPCPNCHQKKLEILTKCPHCGADLGSAAAPPPKA